jgi:hypothetical protein
VLTLYAWVAPFSWGLCKRGDESANNPSTLLARMESSLFWLDLLGKWAFVDTFVLIVLMVAFRATISIPLFGTVIEVWVQCHWGLCEYFYCVILSSFCCIESNKIHTSYSQTAFYLHQSFQYWAHISYCICTDALKGR